MRLLVTGGRDYSDFQALRIVLDQIHKEHPVTLLITRRSSWSRLPGICMGSIP